MCDIFFFFQAEDGIRDYKVTGVQTCALPIYGTTRSCSSSGTVARCSRRTPTISCGTSLSSSESPMADERPPNSRCQKPRSEERRVGKECKYTRMPDRSQKQKKEKGGSATEGE